MIDIGGAPGGVPLLVFGAFVVDWRVMGPVWMNLSSKNGVARGSACDGVGSARVVVFRGCVSWPCMRDGV